MKHIRPLVIEAHDVSRLMRKIVSNTDVVHGSFGPSPCWIYTGNWQDGRGYKKMRVNGRSLYVHRVTYVIANGPIPEGLVLDHKCRQRSCCNPEHLEPVTVRENTLRGNGKWIFEQGYTPRDPDGGTTI